MVHYNNFFNGDGKAKTIGYQGNFIPNLGI